MWCSFYATGIAIILTNQFFSILEFNGYSLSDESIRSKLLHRVECALQFHNVFQRNYSVAQQTAVDKLKRFNSSLDLKLMQNSLIGEVGNLTSYLPQLSDKVVVYSLKHYPFEHKCFKYIHPLIQILSSRVNERSSKR
jgi:hypothetical protein